MQAKSDARRQLAHFLEAHRGEAGIVYCLSRKKTEAIAGWLSGEGFDALPYHAGLPAEARAANQRRFLAEDGVIIVATIAFGMGIDKPDVRFVAHLDLPKSVESYYQETGRAGRDGEPADAWMVYGLQDVVQLRQLVDQSEADEQHKQRERHKLDALLGWCEATECRRRPLLSYFGEERGEPCGNCDNCLVPPATWDGTEAARKLLSCVYRTGQSFGAAHVVDVLLGNATEKVTRHRHERLSVFNIGTELDGVGLALVDSPGHRAGLPARSTTRATARSSSPSEPAAAARRGRVARARGRRRSPRRARSRARRPATSPIGIAICGKRCASAGGSSRPSKTCLRM